jgi:hypothetical protein
MFVAISGTGRSTGAMDDTATVIAAALDDVGRGSRRYDCNAE